VNVGDENRWDGGGFPVATRSGADEGRFGPLREYVAGLRTRHRAVPDVDPDDGGASARLLILLETPGPRIHQTGIVSASNPSGTARNLRRFLEAAGLPRHERVIWNTVPWVIHAGGPNRAPRPAEVREGLAELPGFLALLPNLRAVVLAGRVAGLAAETVTAARPEVALVRMPHPSPTYVCTSPEVPRRIAAALTEAAALLGYTGASG
jgi:uracil-DNA glycosylase